MLQIPNIFHRAHVTIASALEYTFYTWLDEVNVMFIQKFECGKCSKISNASYLPKKSTQTVQTQIRLLLKKQSDQGLPWLLFWQAIC